MEPGCAEVQYDVTTGRTPLVLIHDGGGTIFNYYFLDNLSRPVCGIANPKFDSGEKWTQGFAGMAKLYASFITETIPHGEVILGGWSMGGMLALEISHILHRVSSGPKVKGLILIDSPYPQPTTQNHLNTKHSLPTFPATTKQDVREKVLASLQECRRLIQDWVPPEWERSHGPPPGVLLRCKGRETAPDGAELATIDVNRADRLLGWGQYHNDFIKESWDIEGSHFTLFQMQYLEDLSKKVYEACELLDK